MISNFLKPHWISLEDISSEFCLSFFFSLNCFLYRSISWSNCLIGVTRTCRICWLDVRSKCNSFSEIVSVDNVLVELNDRFSSKNIQLLSGVSSLCPENDSFLCYDSLKPFADHFDFDSLTLSNELTVAKSMLAKKPLLTLVDLYEELHPFKQAFPTLVSLTEIAITIPVSSTTCERTFSKMKLIKTALEQFISIQFVAFNSSPVSSSHIYI